MSHQNKTKQNTRDLKVGGLSQKDTLVQTETQRWNGQELMELSRLFKQVSSREKVNKRHSTELS